MLNPFAANRYINLLEGGQLRLRAYAELRAQFPSLYVDDVYPAPGGLLAFAITDNGNVLYWKTVGDSNTWIVVVYEGRGPEHFELSGFMTDFLASVLTRTVVVDVLPGDFRSRAPDFRPYRKYRGVMDRSRAA